MDINLSVKEERVFDCTSIYINVITFYKIREMGNFSNYLVQLILIWGLIKKKLMASIQLYQKSLQGRRCISNYTHIYSAHAILNKIIC